MLLDDYPLSRVSVRGFKSIRELEAFELKSITALIGSNGSGKSNFIEIFHLLKNVIDCRLADYTGLKGGANTLLHFGRKMTDQLFIKLDFDTVNAYSFSLKPTEQDRFIFHSEDCYFWDKKKYPDKAWHENLQSEKGLTESRLKQFAQEKKMVGYVLNRLEGAHIYHFHDTSVNSPIKQTNSIHENSHLFPNGKNLAAYLFFLKMKYKSYYERIVRSIQVAAPFFKEFDLKPDRLNTEKIRLEWLHTNSDEQFAASDLSDGTLRFICLCTLLLQPKPPPLIILDEPELGLHPSAIALLIEMLREAAENKCQILIATQSATLVNYLLPEEIVVVEREQECSTFKRLKEKDLKQWLDTYRLGDLWEKNIIGGRP